MPPRMRGLRLSAPARAVVVQLIPSAGLVVLWTVLLTRDGGFHARDWLAAGLVLLALLAMAMTGARRVLPAGRLARPAVLLFAAFAAWSFVSIVWSGGKGGGLEASDQLLVTLFAGWIVALAPWNTRTATAVLLLFAFVAAVVCFVSLVSAAGADDLAARFTAERWNPPLAYPNTTSALAVMAAVPVVVLAARPGLTLPMSGACMAAAMVLVTFAVLPLSRAAVIGAGVACLLALWLVPYGWRLLLRLLVLGALTAVLWPTVFDVYERAQTGSVGPAIQTLLERLWPLVLVAGVSGCVLTAAERRWSPRSGRAGVARRAGHVLAAVVAVGAIALGVVEHDRVGDAVQRQYRAATNTGADTRVGAAEPANRLLDSNPRARYDYWRVSLEGLRGNPLGGLGAGGFEHQYTVDRRYATLSKYPHSLLFALLGGWGIVGFGLVLAVGALLVCGLIRGVRRASTGEQALVAIAIALLADFLVQGSLDWVEAYPVLTILAFAVPLIVLDVRRNSATARDADPVAAAVQASHAAPRRPWLTRVGWVAAPLAGGLVILALFPAWVAVRLEDRGVSRWREQPAAGLADLSAAAGWNPLDSRPDILRGTIALVRREPERAANAFRAALAREDEWYSHYGLAVALTLSGERAEARREAGKAVARNRLSPMLPDAVRELSGADDVDPVAALRAAVDSPLPSDDPAR